MSTFKPADYHEWREKIPPVEIRVTSYKLGDTYHCTVDYGKPGTVISRFEAGTRLEAEKTAVAQAREKIARNGADQR